MNLWSACRGFIYTHIFIWNQYALKLFFVLKKTLSAYVVKLCPLRLICFHGNVLKIDYLNAVGTLC